MKIISVRGNPGYKDKAVLFLQASWPTVYPPIYEDCLTHCLDAENDLPQWYLLEDEERIIGCAGLITNDFISRMDLYPWLCALFISEDSRGHDHARLLIGKAKEDAKSFGFRHMYLSTDLNNYYEKLGFEHVGQGYHPWEEESKIYRIGLI